MKRIFEAGIKRQGRYPSERNFRGMFFLTALTKRPSFSLISGQQFKNEFISHAYNLLC